MTDQLRALEDEFAGQAEAIIAIARNSTRDTDEPASTAVIMLIGSDSDNALIVHVGVAGDAASAYATVTSVSSGERSAPTVVTMGDSVLCEVELPPIGH